MRIAHPVANVIADEIVAPGATVELTFGAAVDPQSAQGSIRVMHRREPIAARIAVSQNSRRGNVQIDAAVIGACELVIAELLSATGEAIVDRYRLPFFVVPISGTVPRELRVEHAVRLFIGELRVHRLAPGETNAAGHLDVVKAVH